MAALRILPLSDDRPVPDVKRLKNVRFAGYIASMNASHDSNRRYREYLESTTWKETRRRKLTSVGHRCERCGRTAWHVHHLDYRNLGREDNSDLRALCGRCHQEEHLKDRHCLGCGRSLVGYGSDRGELATRCMDCDVLWYLDNL